MPRSELREAITPPDEHILTVQEALEPVFLALEAEVDRKLIVAATEAGWEPHEVLTALEALRQH